MSGAPHHPPIGGELVEARAKLGALVRGEAGHIREPPIGGIEYRSAALQERDPASADAPQEAHLVIPAGLELKPATPFQIRAGAAQPQLGTDSKAFS